MSLTNETIRNGIALTVIFLLEAEADFLCRAKRYARTEDRMNMRGGYYSRKLQLKVGDIKLTVPHLRHLRDCPSMLKRFKRLQDMFVHVVCDIHSTGARSDNVGPFIKAMWMAELSDELHARLTEGLSVVLNTWRQDVADKSQNAVELPAAPNDIYQMAPAPEQTVEYSDSLFGVI